MANFSLLRQMPGNWEVGHIKKNWILTSWNLFQLHLLIWDVQLVNNKTFEYCYIQHFQQSNYLPTIFLLIYLRLSVCNLHHIPPLLDHNFSSLETLDLVGNNFNSPVPKWVFNLSNLVSLYLLGINFIGPFPKGFNSTSLTTFGASNNSFNCSIPECLFDLNNLEIIEGTIPSKTENVTKHTFL